MTESTIITGQFVRISQTPASIGERLMALIIDYFLIGLYILSTATLLSKLSLPSGFSLFFFCASFIYRFSVILFFARCSITDKALAKTHQYPCRKSRRFYSKHRLLSVTMASFPIDGPITSGLGLLVVLLNKNNQRLGDLAAGTMVIKEKTIVRYMSAWTNSII